MIGYQSIQTRKMVAYLVARLANRMLEKQIFVGRPKTQSDVLYEIYRTQVDRILQKELHEYLQYVHINYTRHVILKYYEEKVYYTNSMFVYLK